MREETIPIGHFSDLYAARSDPWHLADSAYERDKYAATLAALPRERYARALEVGCANGDFTAMLAARCDALLAIEPVGAALQVARRKNAARPWVGFASMFVPAEWPAGTFDLVVISEVIDYLGSSDVAALSQEVCASLELGGDAILVHWIGKKSGPPSRQEATDMFIAAAEDRLEVLRAERTPGYRLDVVRRVR